MKLRPWTGAEQKRLKSLWVGDYTVGEIAGELDRSIGAVVARARYLNLGLRIEPLRGPDATVWTAEAEGELRRLWGTAGPDRIALLLGRTVADIERRAAVLRLGCVWEGVSEADKIRMPKRTGQWDLEERKRLRRLWGFCLDLETIAGLLGRSHRSIIRMAGLWGVSRLLRYAPKNGWEKRRWSAEDIERLGDLSAAGRTPSEIALEMGRGALSVKQALDRYCKNPAGSRWREWEDAYLQRNYAILPKEQLCRHLKRNWAALQRRASCLGIATGRRLRNDQLVRIKALIRGGWTDERIGEVMKVPVDWIAGIRVGYQIKRRPFTEAEDERLTKIIHREIRDGGKVDWKKVGLALYRSAAVCRDRAVALNLI